MANLTLVSNQLFLGTFIITSLGQKNLQTAKWKLKYKELCLLVYVDCHGSIAYTVSDVVLDDGSSGTNYILNLFWGIVLN